VTISPESTDASLPDAVRAVVAAFSARPEVTAIALGGSVASGAVDASSDHDLYLFTTSLVSHEVRRDLATRFDPVPEIGNRWFGEGDEWSDRANGVSVDLMFWDRDWFEGQLRDVIERHQPSLGYTTSLWFTARHAVPLFDREGWLAKMRAFSVTPYPEELRTAIIVWNRPLLRITRSSYRHQIELAIRRDDPVSVNHRVAALLASALDIVFASMRALHPGEKRQLAHIARLGDRIPPSFGDSVRKMLGTTADPVEHGLLGAIDELCDAVDEIVRQTDCR
jgi:hypothetical protein